MLQYSLKIVLRYSYSWIVFESYTYRFIKYIATFIKTEHTEKGQEPIHNCYGFSISQCYNNIQARECIYNEE